MKEKVRAKNNRTTFVTEDEIPLFKRELLSAKNVNNENFCNKTIFGQLEEVAPKLPNNFVDLLFIDLHTILTEYL
jgi:hypothetical protein